MIAATIGRTFLVAYNKENLLNLSAKEFFEKKFIPQFYDSPKYMQWITNSPFVQGLSADPKGIYGIREKIKDDEGNTITFDSKEFAAKYLDENIIQRKDFQYCYEKKITKKGIEIIKTLNFEERKKIAKSFVTKVEKAFANDEFDGSIAIGFPASDVKGFQTTSGQVTDMNFNFKEDDIYLSWIGNGLGVGIEGGFSIFFNNEEILYSIYEGWQAYRNILDDKTTNIKGNQVETWNGQWLAFKYDKYYKQDHDFKTLHNFGFFKVDGKFLKVDTIFWAKIIFKLSRFFSGQTILGYIYNFADTNKTLGFYTFHLNRAEKIIKYYKSLFGEQAALQDAKQYEALFGMYIKRACELGSIGIQALEPQDLRKYFGKGSNLKLTKPNIKQKQGEGEEEFNLRKENTLKKDYTNIVTYRTYKTWLLAMITKNKEESLEYTNEVAKALHEYRAGATKLDRKNLIQSELLVAKSKKNFLDALTTIIKEVDKNALDIFKSLRDRVHMMSAEDFGYFVVLLKFDYAYVERNL